MLGGEIIGAFLEEEQELQMLGGLGQPLHNLHLSLPISVGQGIDPLVPQLIQSSPDYLPRAPEQQSDPGGYRHWEEEEAGPTGRDQADGE